MTNLHNSEHEQWKDIAGYEGYYEVSNLGRIRSITRFKAITWRNKTSKGRQGRVLKPGSTATGYQFVLLSVDGVKKSAYVHVLVATAFIPNPDNKPEVNHKKGIKTDNRASELEWSTRLENVRHYFYAEDRLMPWQGMRNEQIYNSRPVSQYSKQNDLLKTYPSAMEAERAGFSATKITMVCRGKRHSHGGYKWQYA